MRSTNETANHRLWIRSHGLSNYAGYAFTTGLAKYFPNYSPIFPRFKMISGLNYLSKASYRCILSLGSAGSILSLASASSILSLVSIGSMLSIGSVGSILSIGSVGSILSIGSVGSIFGIFQYHSLPNHPQ
jgi:hypothetical protein